MSSLQISNNYSEIPAVWNTPAKTYNSPGFENEIGVIPQRAATLGIVCLVVSLIYYCIQQLASGEPRVASARIKSKETEKSKAPALPSLKTKVIMPSSPSQQVPVGDSTQVAPSGINAGGNSVPNSNLQVEDEADIESVRKIDPDYELDPEDLFFEFTLAEKVWAFKEILGEFSSSNTAEQEMKQSRDSETVPSNKECTDFDPDLKFVPIDM